MNGQHRASVSFLAVGDKGYQAVADAAEDVHLAHIVTYPQATSTYSMHDFERLGSLHAAKVSCTKQPSSKVFADSDVVFAVGWQYMIAAPPRNLVVLHDSLLPRYRGFAPTISAIIDGATRIGVTALLPDDSVDEGDILAQRAIEVPSPLRIADALQQLRPCYRSVIVDTLAGFISSGSLIGRAQEHQLATYSQWRDDCDYYLDFTTDAEEVMRHVYAVGAPYAGAQILRSDGVSFGVRDAEIVADVNIVRRTPGKVWSNGPDSIDIVCGTGIVRLSGLVDNVGEPTRIATLRTRFISPSSVPVWPLMNNTESITKNVTQ